MSKLPTEKRVHKVSETDLKAYCKQEISLFTEQHSPQQHLCLTVRCSDALLSQKRSEVNMNFTYKHTWWWHCTGITGWIKCSFQLQVVLQARLQLGGSVIMGDNTCTCVLAVTEPQLLAEVCTDFRKKNNHVFCQMFSVPARDSTQSALYHLLRYAIIFLGSIDHIQN